MLGEGINLVDVSEAYRASRGSIGSPQRIVGYVRACAFKRKMLLVMDTKHVLYTIQVTYCGSWKDKAPSEVALHVNAKHILAGPTKTERARVRKRAYRRLLNHRLSLPSRSPSLLTRDLHASPLGIHFGFFLNPSRGCSYT